MRSRDELVAAVTKEVLKGEARGYAKGRAAGLEEAAEMAAGYSPRGGYDNDTAGRAAMKAGDDIAAAIRALKAVGLEGE